MQAELCGRYNFCASAYTILLLQFLLLIKNPEKTRKMLVLLRQDSLNEILKGTLSGLGQFLANENPLKMIKKLFFHLFSFTFHSQDI